MDIYAEIVDRIIKEQQSIIGPIALDQARKVEGISFSENEIIKVQGNGKTVLEHLVSQYEKFFGKASIEVCRDALAPIKDKLTSIDLPEVLKN